MYVGFCKVFTESVVSVSAIMTREACDVVMYKNAFPPFELVHIFSGLGNNSSGFMTKD